LPDYNEKIMYSGVCCKSRISGRAEKVKTILYIVSGGGVGHYFFEICEKRKKMLAKFGNI